MPSTETNTPHAPQNPVQHVKQSAATAVAAAAEKAAADGVLPSAQLSPFVAEIPGDLSHGDVAVNAALVSAKALRLPPRKIGEALLAHLDLENTPFEKAEIAGPGFLNFFLKPAFFANRVRQVLQNGEDYGRTDEGGGKRINVEFVSANPTGPMHLGNARGGAIGDCLAAALDWAGYEVSREFYINDAGNQIEKFGHSLSARYLQHYKGEEAVPFPEDGYKGGDIAESARAYIAEHGDDLLELPEEQRSHRLISYALPRNIENMKAALEKYRIYYDTWFSEKSLHDSGAVMEAVKLLGERGHTYEKDGAIWYKATAFGADKDEVLVRQNGIPTYFAADIAYHHNKLATRGFDTAIDVWGADHHGHVARMKASMDAVGLSGDRLDVVLMQLVNLMRDGVPERMSKRSGKAVTLVDLLEEVPVDAVRFLFNMREPTSHMDFDMGLALQESADNPVYYVQYAHARVCSIEKALAAQNITFVGADKADLSLLTHPAENALIRELARFPEEIAAAARTYDPARIPRYLVDLATAFHKFYSACRVLGASPELLQARLALCLATRQVLANGLGMLKVTAPQSMQNLAANEQ